MPMMPKRVKYRKSQKGRVRGNATRGNYVAFGEYGLQSLEPGRISAATIEAGRVVASQSVKGGGKLYIRIFPHKSITSIPAETRMGKGKGEVEYWAAIVKPGTDPLRDRRRQRGARPQPPSPASPTSSPSPAGSSPGGPRCRIRPRLSGPDRRVKTLQGRESLTVGQGQDDRADAARNPGP